MWQTAIYAREPSGHVGRSRLERQVAGLAAGVARQPGWRHVATYVDQAPRRDRTRPRPTPHRRTRPLRPGGRRRLRPPLGEPP